MLEEHELVEGVVPLHEEHTPRQGTAKIFVTIVRVSTYCTLSTTLGLWNLGGHAVLFGHKFLWYFSHGIHRNGEPVVLLGVGMETNQVMSEQAWGLARQSHQHVLDYKHPDCSTWIQQVHCILMQFIEVQGIDPLLCPHQDMLVVGVRVNPASSAIDF